VENVILKNIILEYEGGGKPEDIDRPIPENEKGYPGISVLGVLPAYGFYIRHVKNIILDEIQLRFTSDDPRPALVCDDIYGLQIRNLQAQGTSQTPALILLKIINDATISNCKPVNKIPVFIKLKEGRSSGISLLSNQLGNAEKTVIVENESLGSAITEYGTIR